jgi:hypothetical protein
VFYRIIHRTPIEVPVGVTISKKTRKALGFGYRNAIDYTGGDALRDLDPFSQVTLGFRVPLGSLQPRAAAKLHTTINLADTTTRRDTEGTEDCRRSRLSR